MTIYAYARASTEKQDINNQVHEITTHCLKTDRDFNTKNIFKETISSRKTKEERVELVKLEKIVKKGDTIIVSELSRLGRDTVEVIQTTKELLKKGVTLICIKEALTIEGAESITAMLVLPLLSAINEIERQRIKERTISALAAKKAAGVKLGRPEGSLNSKLDEKKELIKEMLEKNISKASIAKHLNTTRVNLYKYLNNRPEFKKYISK